MASLSDFRLDQDPESNPLPVIDGWWHGMMVAFDQSLSNTGFLIVKFSVDGAHVVSETGMIRTETPASLRGHAANLSRSTAVFRQVVELLEGECPDMVLVETPPVGPKMSRPESSLLAADAVFHAVESVNREHHTQIGYGLGAAQRAKKFLTGKANADKKAIRDPVLHFLPDLKNYSPLNEHIYDAAAIALTYAKDHA